MPLPDELAALHKEAERRLRWQVWLLEMTTDLGVPAYWAYTPAPEPTAAARLRGCGASLSARYAAERALSELIQSYSLRTEAGPTKERRGQTPAYPPLHRCYLADFSTRIPEANVVPFSDNTTVPDTPHGHLAALREALGTSGFTPRAYERHVSDNLAVVNIIIPGLERFFLITEGDVVVPGSRGITFLNHP
ncbi:YcaO-like family protein [Streptomyces noursei]|uniref:YcaO-like family protein n=1 Tax=Streptomyces noursei TaxID=1971 RepID=UPI0036D32499